MKLWMLYDCSACFYDLNAYVSELNYHGKLLESCARGNKAVSISISILIGKSSSLRALTAYLID